MIEILRTRAEQRPHLPVYRFLGDGETETEQLTYGALDVRARAIAGQLQSLGVADQRALLLYPPGLEFVAAFLGCLFARAVAVPAYLPRPNRPMTRLRSVIADSQPAIVLTTSSLLPDAERWAAEIPELQGRTCLATDKTPAGLADRWQLPAVGPETVAFLQYTSGSTARAKGVIVSHGNLVHNSALIQRCFGSTAESRGVFWLPLYHDMGLIGGVLQTLYCGGSSTLMAPLAFLQRPLRWLQAISRTGATISGGPNFAFDLCVRKVTPEERAELDLSRWAVAFNGAEPIRPETIERFVAAFGPCGFRPEAFLPCYGLAEATLLVSGGHGAVVRSWDAGALERNLAIDVQGDGPARVLVGCGEPAETLDVAIVEPETGSPCADGRVGEIWVAGPSVAQGYWNQPDATAAAFRARLADEPTGRFLRTGDLGFLRDGSLFVAGRLKDLIIIQGRNIHPQDIEWTVARSHPALPSDAGAAFAIERQGQERLVVVHEVERHVKPRATAEILSAIRRSVAEQHELELEAVCLIRPMSLPRTSSGKTQRHVCREHFLAGSLELVAASTRAEESAQAERDAPGSSAVAPIQPAAQSKVELIEQWLCDRIAQRMGLAKPAIGLRTPVASFGLGSLHAVSLAGELQEWLGRPVSPTLVYEYPTIEALAQFLAGEPSTRQTPNRVEFNPEAADQPIALIGIGCRFPGAAGPAAFWQLLREGIDAIGEVPPDRWPAGDREGPGAATRWGGFLDRIDRFDADFFGISPREANQMDPQQRMLLEVAWEALEDAGQAPDLLAGRAVGVFIGISTHDYNRILQQALATADAYAVTGTAASVAANRISYAFDFRGPSLAVDTACSSSLVAVHLACQSLRRGEAELVLAGGVNLILCEDISAQFAQGGFLAADGRCRAFDAGAGGYVRGEGAGVVVLKPLARALADGDPVYAIIRGSAVNQDGRTNGLTAPSRQGQEAVLSAAYRSAGVSAGDLQYLEAHGTGTPLGDPIEAKALASILGPGRPADRPCAIGSVKTNIGHLEAAAGIAGLIKTALALERRSFPASLHFEQLNPHIGAEAVPFRIVRELENWPEAAGPRLAGVSSFGFGGTNAHVVLEGFDLPRPTNVDGLAPRGETPYLLSLSARQPAALRALAQSMRDSLETDLRDASLADIVLTAGARRAHHSHRLAVLGRSHAELKAALDAFVRGEDRAGLATGQAMPGRRQRLVFVFSGQGTGTWGVGRELIDQEPVFRAGIEECDEVLRQEAAGWSILTSIQDNGIPARVEALQAAHFAFQVALAALWRSWGIVPDVVVGHSLGEIAAAHVAGALTLADAMRVVLRRARLMETISGRGKTATLGMSLPEASALVEQWAGRLSLAAINGPCLVTLSGDPEAVAAIVQEAAERQSFARMLEGDIAYHSEQLQSLQPRLVEALSGLAPRTLQIPMLSTVTGRWCESADLNSEYWGRNLRQTVRFAHAVETLLAEAPTSFLEVGPQSNLTVPLRQMQEPQREGMVVASMRRGHTERESLLRALGELYVSGQDVQWKALAPRAQHVGLPTYPWQHERFWLDSLIGSASRILRNGERNGHETTKAAVPAGRPKIGNQGRQNGHAGYKTRRMDSGAQARAIDELLYEVQWQLAPAQDAPGAGFGMPGAPEHWLIVTPDESAGLGLLRALEGSGSRGTAAVADPANPSAIRKVLSSFSPQAPRGVVFLCDSGRPVHDEPNIDSVEELQHLGCGTLLHLVQAVVERGWARPPRIWVVTRGAQPVDSDLVDLACAPLWGLGRSLAREHPTLWGGLIDLDPENGMDADSLLAELLRTGGEDQVAVRGGHRYVPRLVRTSLGDSADSPLTLRPEGTYVITGGLGGLGLKVARWMVERGARRLVLFSRRRLPGRARWNELASDAPDRVAVEAIQELERQGATVHVAAVDVADREAMTDLFQKLADTLPPVRGIVHAAGVVYTRAAIDTDLDSLGAMLRPKSAGTLVLGELARTLQLDFLVMFSSVASVSGFQLLSGYAAANSTLDALAHRWRAEGLPALSINWGPWDEVGMAPGAEQRRLLELVGLRAIATDVGLRTLERLIISGAVQVTVADVDWPTFKQVYDQQGRGQFLDRISVAETNGPAPTQHGGPVLDLKTMPNSERRRLLVDVVRERVAGVLGMDPARIDAERPLNTLGLDSLMALELQHSLESLLKTRLSLVSLLQEPTLNGLAAQIEAVCEQNAPETTQDPALVAPSESDHALSFGQQSLWYLHQLDPQSVAYTIASAGRISAKLDLPALQRSFQQLLDRHASLRTTFPDQEGRPLRRIEEFLELPLQIEDAAGWSEARIRARIEEAVGKPFDLERGPLVRLLLLVRSEQEHYLLFAVHHIVCDFWSMAILADELGRIYEAEACGRQAELEPVGGEYGQFVRWQAERMSGPDRSRLEEHWSRQLAGPLPILDLPTDRIRPAIQTFRGSSRTTHVNEAVLRKLQQLGESEGASLYVTLLAAFQALLARVCGQDDVIVGTPVTGRTQPAWSGIVGYFVNTLPMRADLAGNPSFRELLRQVRERVHEGLEHQDYPFTLMVDRVQPARDPSRAPVFQAMFAYLKAQRAGLPSLASFALHEPGPRLSLGSLPLESLDLALPCAQFDLTMTAAEAEDGLAVALEYNSDLFEPATIERLLNAFRVLLASIARAPDCEIGNLPLLTPPERERMLELGRPVKPHALPEECLPARFQRQVALTPDAVAVVSSTSRLTYRELNARANQLAHHLRSLGVGPEVIVGLCAERSIDQMVGLLGILKAGGAYLPLDPAYPAQRLSYFLDDSQARVVLVQPGLEAKCTRPGVRLVRLDGERSAWSAEPDHDPPPVATPENLAYAIYTSGSTGTPKGVLIPHRALLSRCDALVLEYELDPSDRVLQFASLSFDVAAEEILPTLMCGACLCLRPESLATSLDDFQTLLHGHRITVANLPTQYWHEWTLELHRTGAKLPESLRLVVVGGDVAQLERLLTWQRLVGDRVRWINAYGPTEATITATLDEPLAAGAIDALATVPIGRPIGETRAYVLDSNGEPVPVGVRGELWLGGPELARGYHGRPGLTASAFRPDPLSGEPGERLYRTGDLARWRADGRLEFLGRVDQQVKVRGFRVELGEVECALRRHPAVREAVAVVHEEPSGGRRLAAYLTCQSSSPDESELRSFLAAELPDYMVPSAFVVLDALPVAPHGKVDRSALRLPARDSARAPEGSLPRNPAEETLATLTASLLGVAGVGIHENLFQLGLDSITSIQIVSRARQAGLHLTPGQLFQHQTIAELAAVANTTAPVTAEQGPVSGTVPLTPIQRWFFEQGPSEPHHDNQAVLLCVEPGLRSEVLARAVAKVIEHHDALRLRFKREPGGWLQFHSEPEADLPFVSLDWSAVSDTELPFALPSAAVEWQASLNLTEGPICRVIHVDLGNDRPGRLLWLVHHLVVDAVSWRILIEDLATLCRQITAGEPTCLPAKTTSFRQWAEQLVEWARSDEAVREAGFWAEHPPVTSALLPLDEGTSREPGTEAIADRLSLPFTEEETRKLLNQAAAGRVATVQDLLLAALAQAVSAGTDHATVLIDLEGHGREPVREGTDLSRTVGWFTSMFPVALDVDSRFGPAQALRAVRETLGRLPRHGLGYGVVRYLNPDAEIGAQLRARPRAEIGFNYLGQILDGAGVLAGNAFTLADEPTGPVRSPLRPRAHLLEVEAKIVRGRLEVAWIFRRSAHKRGTVVRLAARFRKALRRLLEESISKTTAEYTSADFPLARLDQATLDRIFSGQPGIEDIYPLSPAQQGILFHSMMEPEAGVYIQQFTCRLRGQLDDAAFVSAWQRLVARHPALRTAFQWVDADEPYQVVYREAELPVEQYDWRSVPPEAQARKLADCLAEDRRQGFVPSWAPLSRLTLMRLEDDLHHLVWTSHHLLTDGWCMPILLREVLAMYEAGRAGRAPRWERCTPYREYIAWLMQQDASRAESYWRQALEGFRERTKLGIERAEAALPADLEPFQERRAELGPDSTSALEAYARRHQLTLSTLLHGVWALLLSRYSGQPDVMFGTTCSGRPADLPGVETMIGLFINTLPVRVRVSEDRPLVGWLQELQTEQARRLDYQQTPLVAIQGWSEVPRGQALFETLLVFENYPIDSTLPHQASRLGIDQVQVYERTNYPLTLTVVPGRAMRIQADFDARRFPADDIERLLRHYQTLLAGVATDDEGRLADLPMLSREEWTRLVRQGQGPAPELAPGPDGEPNSLKDEELDSLLDQLLIPEQTSDE